jgi:hypothetical protein
MFLGIFPRRYKNDCLYYHHMNWKILLFLVVFGIGLLETYTKDGAIRDTVDMFVDDPVNATVLNAQRWFVWEGLTPVFPVWTTPSGNTIFFFWYSAWDGLILIPIGVLWILTMKAFGKWNGSVVDWLGLIILLFVVWFAWKGLLHAWWIQNNALMYGLSAVEADQMLLATSNLAVGIIGILNFIVTVFVMSIAFKVVSGVGRGR